MGALLGESREAIANLFLVDNLSGFRTSDLATFVFPPDAHEALSAAELHSHKVDYYQRSAKRIRDFYVKHVEKKLVALDSLISAATKTREQFHEAVTMANNRLTESWRSTRTHQEVRIAGKQSGESQGNRVDGKLSCHDDLLTNDE